MNVHYHRSIRLKGCDYAQAGAYFVTMCTQDRACPLGDVVGEEVRLSDAGSMIQAAWEEMSDHYPGAETDAFVVMPNHIHGIIVIPGRGEASATSIRAFEEPRESDASPLQPYSP